MKMPYYDDEMTDRAVKAWARWCLKTYGAFSQPNRYETFRDGNTITIGRYNGKPMARYRVKSRRHGGGLIGSSATSLFVAHLRTKFSDGSAAKL